jgi:hypothetical protein
MFTLQGIPFYTSEPNSPSSQAQQALSKDSDVPNTQPKGFGTQLPVALPAQTSPSLTFKGITVLAVGTALGSAFLFKMNVIGIRFLWHHLKLVVP